MKIGTLIKDEKGTMLGRLHGIGVGSISLMLQPHTSREGKEYFKVVADPAGEAFEAGVAFLRQKNGSPYYSVTIDSPSFAKPLHAALFQQAGSENTYDFVWNRGQEAEPKVTHSSSGPKAALHTPAPH
jgi:uncharacterized protein (DUF736 family)